MSFVGKSDFNIFSKVLILLLGLLVFVPFYIFEIFGVAASKLFIPKYIFKRLVILDKLGCP